MFAAVYFVLGTIPVFPLSTGGFLRANKVIAPLAGMLLGPILGGASMILGSFLYVAFSGQPPILPLGPLPLDFVPDSVVATLSGLAFSGRRKLAIGVRVFLLAVYFLDPISVTLVDVSNVSVPFAWLLVVSVVMLTGILLRNGHAARFSSLPFVAIVTLTALLSGQLAGTIVGQNINVRFGTLALSAWQGKVITFPWGFFYTYPVERAIYTVASVLISFPVLRALSKKKSATVSE